MITSRVPFIFQSGETYISDAAMIALRAEGLWTRDLLNRHERGDWGDVSRDIAKANNDALVENRTLVSMYNLPSGQRILVITEADRTRTTLYLANEQE